MRLRNWLAAALLLSATLLSAQAPSPGPAEQIADGILLYRLGDPDLLSPPGPIAVQALRLDSRKVSLTMGIAGEGVPARETVPRIAERTGAIAAVNAGFFSMTEGHPSGLLKKDGMLLGGTSRPRGAVAFVTRNGATHVLFDRVTAGNDGYRTRMGTSRRDWSRAPHAVGGAGLLLFNGRTLQDWTVERIAAGFDTTRHPRTLIGVDASGAIWLVTVDGRNPALSLGMSFSELQALSGRLGLRSALNLDGGGSTTMVVQGKVVNHPSDPQGPRPVSDAIVVHLKR